MKAGGFCSTQSGITIPVNVSFEIWDASNSTQLASGTTGDIPESTSPNWLEYGLIFQTLPGQSTVILKMVNNGNGGCGNDLAIDDIEFKSCGDVTTVTGATNNTSVNVCSSLTPFSIELTATPDFSVYSDHFYQWQESSDGNLWDDILGETNQSILVTVGYTGHYRTKVAESASNLDNPQCISFSNEFIAGIISAPFLPTLECWETAIMNATTCSWEISGTQPEQPVLEQWETSVFNTLDCIWDVSGTPPFLIMEEYLELCTDSELELIAYTDIETPDFAWSSGEITKNIKIEEPGVYSVDITNGVDSFQTIIFNVNYSENPMIDSVISNQDSIIIKTVNSGDFLYSLDDIVFQSSNIFYNVEGGIYTIGVKNKDCDFTSRLQHLHFYVPKFFTPNMDGINDTFNLFGIQNYSSSQVAIFDRYGKLLVFSSNSSFEWDGTYNNQIMPSGDYWYWIIVEGHKITGHVNMKR
ncbi:MAG: T9SS type B sorting domain-containing protein [Arenibacter sp.]